MPRATSCNHNGRRIGVDEALRWRDQARTERGPDPDFRCVERNQPVRAHAAGGDNPAHIEHHERNEDCTLSDPPR